MVQPSERDQQIVAMYRGGRTLVQVGRAFGMTKMRVSQIVAAAGVDARPAGRPRTLRRRVPVAKGPTAYVDGRKAQKVFKLSGLALAILRATYARTNAREVSVLEYLLRRHGHEAAHEAFTEPHASDAAA